MARLWQAGSPIDWAALHAGEGRRIELPTYPFQRKRYWIDAVAGSSTPRTEGRTYDRTQWTYLPTWRAQRRRVAGMDEALRLAGPWLVCTADPRGEAIVAPR